MGDNDSGGLGFGLFFDTGGGVFGLVLLVFVICCSVYCSLREQDQHREFCLDVCAQYGDAPVIQGSQCYCRDEQGVYDPAGAR